MKAHTSTFKNNIKLLGREIDSKITYELDGETIELGTEQLNSITPHYEADILKSVMKQLDIDSNVDIPVGTEVNYQFGLKVGNSYEYLDYGNYIIYSSEKQEDTRSYKIVCYDKMLYAMKDYSTPITRNLFDKNATAYIAGSYIANDGSIVSNYEFSIYKISVKSNQYYTLTNSGGSYAPGLCYFNSNDERLDGIGYQNRATITFRTPENTSYILMSAVTRETSNRYDLEIMQLEEGNQATSYVSHLTEYPITIKSYLENISRTIGLTLKDTNFVNYDKELTSELYLDSEGNSLNYTYRDVLDEIAGATASTICINEDDELEVRYITTTQGKNYLDFNNATYFKKNAYLETYKILSPDSIEVNTNANGTYGSVWFDINLPDGYVIISAKAEDNPNTSGSVGIGIEQYPIGSSTRNLYIEAWINQAKRTSGERGVSNKLLINNSQYTYKLRVFGSQNPAVANQTKLYNIMIEQGETATEYEPPGDTINEEYLKDINVNFGEKYGPVNSVVFSRSAESDNIYRKDDDSIEENGLTEIKIVDNQILNSNTRDDFIEGVFNQLNGFEYYANDFTSTGITYYDLCDRYNVKVEDKFYSCVMLNDELDVTQGLEEKVHTDIPEQSETDYKKADKTDRRINQAYWIVDKQNQTITGLAGSYRALQDQVDGNEEAMNYFIGTTYEQDKESIKLSVIGEIEDDIETNGVPLVKTTMVTIDDNGLNVSTDNSKISTSMTNEAFTINSSDKELAFFGYDRETNSTRAQMDNLTITNYLTMGNHRVEKFNRDGEDRTGFFYIGGR